MIISKLTAKEMLSKMFGLPTFSLFTSLLLNLDKIQYELIKGSVHIALQGLLIYGIFSVCRRSLFLRTFFAVFIVSDLFVGLAYNSLLSISVIMSVLESSWQESLEFVRFHLPSVILSVFVLLGLIFSRVYFEKKVNVITLLVALCYLVLPMVAISFSGFKAEDVHLQGHIATAKGRAELAGTFELYLKDASYRFRPIRSISGIHDVITFMSIKADNKGTWSNVRVSGRTPNLMVLVIGESQRLENMSLFGYHRKTTPKLDEISDSLQLYKHVYAAGPNTWTSVPFMLTKESKNKNVSKSIINLANKGGFRTHWYSNQARYSWWDYSVTSIAEQANDTHFLSANGAGLVLDEELVVRLEKEINNITEDEKHLFVLNLYGSHMVFKERYPEQFSVFSGGNELLNEYDNSILYLDTLLSRIINLTRDNNGQFMYFSDHGLGDPNGEMALKHDLREPPDMNSLHVPLITFKDSNLHVGTERVISMYYFECIFSEWASITADELTEIGQCGDYLDNNDTIIYLDQRLNKRRKYVGADSKNLGVR